ncbi:MAG: U32 family peptidase [Oscillospiraceae bacterium]|nr:U32 family peptidase [Oscillospiraceae bacterium]MBQ4538698.1 U32 family peptidase [Oscillospiraceae bacterium]
MNKPELLCPAGDFERLKTAIKYGADAVYIGATDFGMRTAPSNFTIEQLYEAADYAHQRGVKLHLTVNTLPRCYETPALPDFLKQVGASGVDALIIADIGIVALARKLLPDMEIHASTQTGIVNELTARTLYDMGVKRVVLAREVSLEEIKVMRSRLPEELEIETFIHGAMCMSISGRCVISNYLTGRDANRGECSQPCRWNYHLMEEKRPGIFLPVFEDEHGTTILNAKDLCMIEHLKELADAGIASFKIEGRAKSPYYVGVVVNAYRTALDAAMEGKPVPEWALRELDTVSHREYSTGFYYGRQPHQQSYYAGGYVQDWEVSAVVEKCENGRLYLTEKNRFEADAELELLEPGKPPVKVKAADLRDEEGNLIDAARHPHMKASIAFEGEASEGAMLRREKNPQ